MSTTFAWASGNYTHTGGGSGERRSAYSRTVVTWTTESLASQEMLTVTLAVTVEHLPRGTRVVNGVYGVRASELPVPFMGTPVEAVVPWRYVLLPIFRNWSAGGNGDD
jgi:hypothetical protein